MVRACACGERHAPCCLLDDEKPAISRDLDGLSDRFRVELGNRTVRRCSCCVIDDDIGFAEPLNGVVEQPRHPRGIRRVDGECSGAGLRRQRRQLLDISRGQAEPEAGRRQTAGNRGVGSQPIAELSAYTLI